MKYIKKQLYTVNGDQYQYMGCSNSNPNQIWSYHVFFSAEKSKRLRIQTRDLKNYKIEEIQKNE